MIVLDFDYVLPEAGARPPRFETVPPPVVDEFITPRPPDAAAGRARAEANRAAALAIREAKRRRPDPAGPVEAVEGAPREAPLGLAPSAPGVDRALGQALARGAVTEVHGPPGSGVSWLCAALAARALARRPGEAVLYHAAPKSSPSRPPPRKIRVPAAASPRLVAAEYPRPAAASPRPAPTEDPHRYLATSKTGAGVASDRVLAAANALGVPDADKKKMLCAHALDAEQLAKVLDHDCPYGRRSRNLRGPGFATPFKKTTSGPASSSSRSSPSIFVRSTCSVAL